MVGFQEDALQKSTPILAPHYEVDNSVGDYFARFGRHLDSTVNVTANNESLIVNVFQFTETLIILNQWAILTDVTSITNCTNVYADVFDGTNSEDLTKDGITLSGAPVGSFFTKDKVNTETYSLMLADQVRINEIGTDKKAGRPFTITAKNGATNYIRFLLTTNTTLDFTMFLHFEYLLLNGATLTPA